LENGTRTDALAECEIIRQKLTASGGVVDYVEALDPETMLPVTSGSQRPVLFALACAYGTTRLIDNMKVD
jgi:pantothenate synthetase